MQEDSLMAEQPCSDIGHTNKHSKASIMSRRLGRWKQIESPRITKNTDCLPSYPRVGGESWQPAERKRVLIAER